MTPNEAHAWWSRLRHQGLLLSPVVMLERYSDAPQPAQFHQTEKLRDAFTRFNSAPALADPEKNTLEWVDALLEGYLGHKQGRVAKKNQIPEKLTCTVRIGSRPETLRPHRVVFSDAEGTTPALLVLADASPQVGRGRGRTSYARFLELLRGTGHRLGLLTNGRQFRLIYAGLDFESWCEWESDRWFDDGEGSEELAGLRLLLSPDSVKPVRDGISGLLDAVEESRKKQADLSSLLRENVRQAVELVLDEVSSASRTNEKLFASLIKPPSPPKQGGPGDGAASEEPLSDPEAHEALLQATVRVVMRLVVCLFAESRQLLPVNDPVYASSYGVRTLYEMLEEAGRNEGGTHGMMNRHVAWPRLMALFWLIHGGSAHGQFPLRAYGGALFRPGRADAVDPVVRALHVLEHGVAVSDATVFAVLRKLLRGPLPVIRGRTRTFVEGPVDYTDLRTEFIGLIYEGLLDYRLKRTDEQIGPQVFLNLGREPVLPLSRLTDMLANDKKGLKNLLTTLKKEKVTSGGKDDEEAEEEGNEQEPVGGEENAEGEAPAEVEAEATVAAKGTHGGDYLDAVEAAKRWAREAVVLAGLVSKQGRRETDTEYQSRIGDVADSLIKRVVATGEFYLVRAGNTRKGTGTFYTRPQLAVPTAHRTLEALCYDRSEDGTLTPKTPEMILGLKVCDPACGSASFLVAALHYLTEALYRSLCFHKKLDDPAEAKKVTLPYGRSRTGKVDEELVPFPPDDPHRGEGFADRVNALLRRHVVERCIYGVDLNPLAVEFARVSLWVETLDPELPFSFLDHKVKVGNSLVGCWLDRVLDYPLCAWGREGGDGRDGPRTQRIETFLKGPRVGNRRSGDGVVKREMRGVIEAKFQGVRNLFSDDCTTTEQVVTDACGDYERLHDLPSYEPDEREAYYRKHVVNSEPVRRLKAAMDEWCAVWFWPADEESLKQVPTPGNFHSYETPETTAILRRVAAQMKFFHWEVEFPDVFTKDRQGFDALLGNPPWDVMKPNSQEFFTEFDPLYRTYDKQAALRQQKELFDTVPGLRDQWDEYNARFKGLSNWAGKVTEPFNVTLARGSEERGLKAAWERHRQQHVGFADPAHPFHLQGSADLNSYKMFAEVFWHLLRPGGRLGIILPTGIYSDFGTKDLRETLLTKGKIDFMYAFQNEKKVFVAADHSFKQVVLFAARGANTRGFLTRFRMGVGNSPHAHELPDDILRRDEAAMCFTPDDVKRNSPKSLSLVELGSERDLAIFRTVYDHSVRIGDDTTGGEITYATELHMTGDSKHFPPMEKWETRGFKPDVFGQWIGPAGEIALPLYEGSMIHQFDFSYQGWLSGHGATSLWKYHRPDAKVLQPRFLISHREATANVPVLDQYRVLCRSVGRNTLTRTMIAVVNRGVPCGHSLFTLRYRTDRLTDSLRLQSVLDSFVFDYVLRSRLAGFNLSWFIIEECPVPNRAASDPKQSRLQENAACLTFLHRRFAPEWLQLRRIYPELASRQWKHWWAVTEADRLRLRVEIDALCADLYGLTPDDFDWIVRDDTTDPKGFYRVDRQLPFCERLTGLAAAAFRALKAGKWSAEAAAAMSNDEFFAAIGIPEMTAGDEPLIRKRDGCHRWKPEEFGSDDPRHGWTWEHCWADAIALLGSEDAVRKYVEGHQSKNPEELTGPTDLFGNALPPKQGSLF
jgi:hypothetical protein